MKENLALPSLPRLSPLGFMDRAAEKALAAHEVEELADQAPPAWSRRSCTSPAATSRRSCSASGWPPSVDLLVMDEPTRGIDVAAKVEIYEVMNELTARGAGILMISSELPEVLGMSDRILVMRQGRIVAELDAQGASQEQVLGAALGQSA